MLRIERPEPPACVTPEVVAAWTEQFFRTGRMRWDDDCQQQLRAAVLSLCQGRCAFCDGKLGVESRETVEHFRPKHARGWPQLAYVWTNLFPACDICQSAKRDQWDEALLKPDAADYRFDRYFCCNFLTGALDVLPEPLNGEVERASTTLRIFDLNRPLRCNSRLREYRHWHRARRDGADHAELDDYNYRYFLRES